MDVCDGGTIQMHKDKAAMIGDYAPSLIIIVSEILLGKPAVSVVGISRYNCNTAMLMQRSTVQTLCSISTDTSMRVKLERTRCVYI